MPFTPTHVLAVVPLHRLLPLSALAVGAMVPDFPLYFPVGITYETTHSAAGLVTACLPLGLALYLLFERVLRAPLAALAPPRWQAVLLGTPRAPGWRPLALAALALLAGAVSHVVWDAFTHQGRWGTQWWPALNAVISLGPIAAPGYSWFQHGSSAVGLPLLGWLAWRRLHRAADRGPVLVPVAGTRRAAVLGLLLTVPAARGLIACAHAAPDLGARLYELVTVGGRWLALLTVAYAVAWHWRRGWFTPGLPEDA